MTMGPWEIFTVMAVILVCGFWSGWLFRQGQLAFKEGEERERSDDASPNILKDDHFGVRLTPNEHLTAVAHARSDMTGNGRWECNCPNCFKVRAKLAERGRLTIYEQSIFRGINLGL